MRLMLMRHGETPWNRRQRCQGASDVPLSATGRAQAAALAAALSAEPLAAVYASPLRRALDTARAVARPHDLPVVAIPALRELHHGACEGLTPSELRARFAPLLATWARSPADIVLPGGGESMRQLQARAYAALLELAGRHPRDATVAVVAHNLVNLACLAAALGWSLDRFRELRQDTASLSVLELDPDGTARVVALNETAHLGYLPRPTPLRRGEPPAPSAAAPARLVGDLAAPFTYLVLRALASAPSLRVAWSGVAGQAVRSGRPWRAAVRLAELSGAALVVPPPLADQGPALRLVADAEAAGGIGVRLAARLAALRFAEGRDLEDPGLLVRTAVQVGIPAGRAAAALDAATPAGAASAARVAADAAWAAGLGLLGTPAGVAGARVRTGASLLALGRRLGRRTARATAVVALVALCGLTLVGCGRTGLFAGLSPKPRATVEVSEALAETAIARIAVLPFVGPAGERGDAEFLTAEVREALQARPGLSVATAAEVAGALAAAAGGAVPLEAVDVTPGRLRALARALGADAVLTGRLTRFEERRGTALAARVPASVRFSIELWRGADAALLWRGTYDETQEALSENVAGAGTFFRGGGRWLTARELARLGVQELLGQLPVPVVPGEAAFADPLRASARGWTGRLGPDRSIPGAGRRRSRFPGSPWPSA